MPEQSKQHALIIVTKTEVLPGRFELSYRWDGSPTMTVRIDKYFIEEMTGRKVVHGNYPETIDCMPWPLRFVRAESAWDWHCAEYARTDTSGGKIAWLARSAWIQMNHKLRWAYTRLILTAMVWGLAYVKEGSIPSWRDLGRKRL